MPRKEVIECFADVSPENDELGYEEFRKLMKAMIQENPEIFVTIFPSANDPKSSLSERRGPSAERPKIWSKQFPVKIFLNFFLEKILKIEKPYNPFLKNVYMPKY